MAWQGASHETVKLMDDLRRAVPALEPLYVEHYGDNRGELLPHVLMGDIARFAVDATKDGDPCAVLKVLLHFLAEHFDDGPETNELIWVSFLENLLGEDEAQAVLKPLMSDALRAALEQIVGWIPEA